MMKVGYQTIIFGPAINDLESALDTISTAGYQGVEFAQRPDRIRLRASRPGRKPRPVSILGLRERLRERSLELVGLAGGTLDERMLFCEGLGQTGNAFIPAYLYVEGCDRDQIIEAANRGFSLALHPHVFMKNHRLVDADRLLHENPELRWLPDTAHLHIVGDNAVSSIKEYMTRLAAVHIKDWDEAYGRSYHRYAKGFTELGTGDVPVDLVVKHLLDSNYEGWLIVEQDYSKHSIEESARKNAQWLRDQGVDFVQSGPKVNRIGPALGGVPTCSNEKQIRFQRAMLDAASQELAQCYQTVADAIRELCAADQVTVWACSPAREDMSLLASSPEKAVGLPNVISGKTSLVGIALDRLAVTVFDLTEDQPGARYGNPEARFQWSESLAVSLDSKRLIALPALNRFNQHHVRFLVGILPVEEDIPVDADSEFWTTDLALLANDLTRAVDASLDDLCWYASARANLFAARHRDLTDFVNGLVVLIKDFAECEGVSIFLSDTEDRLTVAATTGIEWDPELTEQEHYYRMGEGLTGKVAQRNEPLLCVSARMEDNWRGKSRESSSEVDPKRDNALFVPMVTTSGSVIGIIRCRNKIRSIPVPIVMAGGGPRIAPLDPDTAIFTDDDAAVVDVIAHAVVPHLQVLRYFNDLVKRSDIEALRQLLREVTGSKKEAMAAIIREIQSMDETSLLLPEPASYYICDELNGTPVQVVFEPLTPEDWSAFGLEESQWARSTFATFFQSIAEGPAGRTARDRTEKLVKSDGSKQVLGVVYIGGIYADFPLDCVIESAPDNRYSRQGRQYSGIGTVLLARLVEESQKRLQGGALMFRIAAKSVGFYEHWKFRPHPRSKSFFALSVEDAVDVLSEARNEIRCYNHGE